MSFTVPTVSSKTLVALKEVLVKSGAAVNIIDGNLNKFRVDGHGVKVDALYDPATSILTISIAHKPFFISEGKIQEGLEHEISELEDKEEDGKDQ